LNIIETNTIETDIILTIKRIDFLVNDFVKSKIMTSNDQKRNREHRSNKIRRKNDINYNMTLKSSRKDY